MPRKKVIETPEFREAVGAAVAAALATQQGEFEKKIAGLLTGAPQAASGNDADTLGAILEKLSVNLQALNSQGQRNKPLSPAEIQKREEAQNRLVDLLAAARARPQVEWPQYRLTAKVYLAERLIEPFFKRDSKGPAIATEIRYTGVPSDAMVPMDDDARAIFNAWRETTGGQTILIPTADNRPLHVTAAGLVVRGEPPKRQTTVAATVDTGGLAVSNDANQPEVAVLGTIAQKARTNSVQGAQ